MGKGYCQHGCYPIDKRWHGGGLVGEVDGEEFPIDSIFDLREFIRRKGGGSVASNHEELMNGVNAAESLLKEEQPNDEPYVLPEGGMDRSDPIHEKIKRRGVSISDVGSQAHATGAYLEILDQLTTFYKFDAVTVKEWYRASPQSNLHDELRQRRQQAEQQVNRVLSNLQDLYEQKQLLEHDLRRLEERKAHFDAPEEQEVEGEGYEDELKADFVDLVDQHTGRHSILQMQQNNVFPSITADFYQMSGLDDLSGDGQLSDLPENEKAVLRKKWKLYEQWKQQFRTAVESRFQDVQRRLNSVQTSIEQSEEWLKPYVEDIMKLSGTWEEEMMAQHDLSRYFPQGNASFVHGEKIVSDLDRSPGEETDRYYDVMVMEPVHFGSGGLENPQDPGGGLVVFYVQWTELLCCKHVYEEVFKTQKDARVNRVKNYVNQYVGDPVDISEDKSNVIGRYEDVITEEEKERVQNAETKEQLHEVEIDINQRLAGDRGRRWKEKIREFFGSTDEFHHEDPKELRRQLLGPYFPTQFYLDYKYDNDLHVMK
ncbi:MAG: hypothetical protein SVY41_00155 [Candidatus Nanohaloarchaea archaeon]|nr:hypothetical protein [Candidatus Nanohaloarchaea archaeon]